MANKKKSTGIAHEKSLSDADGLRVQVAPNPSNSHFVVQVKNGPGAYTNIRVLNAIGTVVESFSPMVNQTFRIGEKYRPGVYYVEVVQGSQRVIVKLLKGSN